MKVSLVIPALNEAKGIAAVVREACWTVDEIIIVDGNSTDGTREQAQYAFEEEKAAGSDCVLRIIVESRRGYGRALLTGINAAKHDVVATADADGTYPLQSISGMVRALDDGAIFVTAVRFPLQNPKAMSYRNFVGNDILTWVANVFFGRQIEAPFRDVLSGMWVFRKAIMRWINLYSEGWDFSQEIKVEAARFAGRHFEQYQIVYQEREGESKLQPWRVGLSNLIYFFKHWLGIRHWFHSAIHHPIEADAANWNEHWSQIADKSEQGPATKWRAWLIQEWIWRLGYQRARIVNLGCGVGSLENEIAGEVGKIWFSVDPSIEAIKTAIQKVGLPSNVHFIHGGLEDGWFASSESHSMIDLWVVSEVFEHQSDPKKFLQRLANAMKPGSKAILTFPNGPISVFEREIGHVDHYNPQQFVQLLPEDEFIVDHAGCYGWPFLNAMKRVLMFMGKRARRSATGKPGVIQSLCFRIASHLFRWNSWRSGYQTLVVMRKV